MSVDEAKKMGEDLLKKHGGAFLSKVSGGLITTVPTTVAEAKKMGEDLIKKKGGEQLSKISGGIITTVPTTVDEAKKMGADLIKKEGGKLLSKYSGGIITTVPTTVAEAKQLGTDLIKNKGGEFLSKLTGGLITEMPVPTTLDALLSKVTGGMITVLPTTVEGCKKMGEAMLAKAQEAATNPYMQLAAETKGHAQFTELVMTTYEAEEKVNEQLSRMTGGVITKLPTTEAEVKQLQLAVVDGIKNYAVNEAKRIGTDLIKKKGGEFLAKMTGTDPLDSKRLAPQSKGCFLSTLVKYCIYDTALLTWHVGLAHVTLYVRNRSACGSTGRITPWRHISTTHACMHASPHCCTPSFTLVHANVSVHDG